MVSLPHSLFSPDLADVLSVIAAFSNNEFASLQEQLKSADAFDDNQDRCERIAVLVNSNAVTVKYVISFIAYLYSQANGKNPKPVTRESLQELLDNRLELNDDVPRDLLLNRLAELIGKNDSFDAYRKVKRLKKGFIPNAVSFSSFVDIRPSFTKDRAFVDSVIKIVQFRIETDSVDSDKKYITVQLNGESLNALRDELDDVSRKLNTLVDVDRQLRTVK